ncbi:MAG: ASKHA domain-containing protein [Desulfobacteraceae bacterium]|jgi:uncharacterized 2Fe-2S/4Fe-4S cluster protein (DUF4445 family)
MTALRKYNITFNPLGRSIDVLAGTSILEAVRSAGIGLSATCGGKGSCGQCRVVINEGKVSPLLESEKDILTTEDVRSGQRLACCTFPEGNLKVHIPEKSLLTDLKLQLEGEKSDLEIDPLIRSFDITVKSPTLDEPTADLDRVLEALKDGHNIIDPSVDILALKQLPLFLRKNNRDISVILRNDEIIGFSTQNTCPAGLAVDLGTTKVAAYLMDLSTGEELACRGAINPQSVYGDDVMSRMDSALHDREENSSSPTRLAVVIRDLINEMMDSLTEEAGLTGNNVTDICIVGNTAMTHLFLDLPVEQLAKSPYVAATDHPVDLKARDTGISVCPGTYVHILPAIGGFVGGDHVSMIIGAGIDRKNKVTLGIDIGTNTEIVINNPAKDCLMSLSCPSGPAFEGAHVTDGMRAARGAIESVCLTEDNVECKTIGDDLPVGLCGSGIIDAVAELYRWGIINDRGRFDKDNKRVYQGKFGSEFIIAESSKGNGNIVISQKDIAEVQLAKGAIKAGIESLMEVNGISLEMVDEVIIAGAFGSYINLVSAVDIGLLPAFPNARYIQVGNSAGIGAKMTLVSQKERARARDIARKTGYLELTTHHNFNRRFAEAMRFPLEKQFINNI